MKKHYKIFYINTFEKWAALFFLIGPVILALVFRGFKMRVCNGCLLFIIRTDN